MALLQDLPTAEQLSGLLAPIIGDDTQGVGAALKLLQGLDTGALASGLTARLDGTLSVTVSADATGAVTGDVLTWLGETVKAVPSDPAALIAPLRERLDAIRGSTLEELPAQLLAGIAGLRSLQSLVPPDTRALLDDIAPLVDRLKAELISGDLGLLRRWSESLAPLQAELAPLIAGGPGAEDRLIAYLRTKVEALVGTVLPTGSLVTALARGVGGAVSGDRVAVVAAARTALIEAITAARAELAAGNVSNLAHLQRAEARLGELVAALEAIHTGLGAALDAEAAAVGGLARALERQLAAFEQVEIVDVGNIKDVFAGATAKLEQLIAGLDFDGVIGRVTEVFDRIDAVIAQADLSSLRARLDSVQQRLDAAIEAVTAALYQVVAAVRAALQQVRQALDAVTGALGTFDADGTFHFAVEGKLREFLEGARRSLQDVVGPAVAELQQSVGAVLGQVQSALAAVQGRIEEVRGQLDQALRRVSDQLERIDVPARMEAIRQQLQAMLDALGSVDFDVVADPVIAEINEMRDALKKIDVSSLNEILLGTLKVSVKVVVEMDFTAKITDVLVAKIDEVLAVPRNALKDVEAKAEAGLGRLGALAPAAILAPLDDVFAPVHAQLEQLRLERLVEPLDAWHARAMTALDGVSPAALLAPLAELHARLEASVSAVSPEALLAPLRTLVNDAADQLRRVDVGGAAAELGGVLADVRRALAALRPEQLLAPLVTAFAKITAALDRFQPSALLGPLGGIFAALTAPLERLTEEHARQIAAVFAPLRELPAAFDPRAVFGALRGQLETARGLVQQVDVGRLIAELKGPWDALHASLQVGAGSAALSLRVDALNPLRRDDLARAAAALGAIQTRLEQALAQTEPPAELTRRYEAVRAKLESLIPAWAAENASAASIRRVFAALNPLALSPEIDRLYDGVKAKLRALDPAQIQQRLRATFDRIEQSLASLDPGALMAALRAVVDRAAQALTTLDFDLVTAELGGMARDLHAVVAALDPRPLVAQLDGLAAEVKAAIAALKPSELLAGLREPFESARAIVEAFDPAGLLAPLQATFQRVQEILAQIDVGVVLQPLVDKLQELRDDLAAALTRTETAFNGMLKAIPVSV
jgi:hypothetical protein